VWDGYSCPSNASRKIAFAGKFCPSLLFTISLLLAALTPSAMAQRQSAAAGRAASFGRPVQRSNSHNGSYAHSRYASSFRHSNPYGYTSLPFPFFGDSFDPNDIYSTGYPVASDPPPFLLQAAAALAGSGANSLGRDPSSYDRPRSSQSLMIELQNGRYVRVNTEDDQSIDGEARELALAPEKAVSAAPAPHDLPPALLVFRDGHSEEVRDYTIANGILYARGDYYTDGYWNKKIALSTLNVPQTLQANTARNVNFVLPSSPNEVITRP